MTPTLNHDGAGTLYDADAWVAWLVFHLVVTPQASGLAISVLLSITPKARFVWMTHLLFRNGMPHMSLNVTGGQVPGCIDEFNGLMETTKYGVATITQVGILPRFFADCQYLFLSGQRRRFPKARIYRIPSSKVYIPIRS
jgi:hypothetical protein